MILISPRRAEILAACACFVAAKGGVTDKRAIAESWRKADDESFRRLAVVMAGMKPDPVLRGVMIDELEKWAEEVS